MNDKIVPDSDLSEFLTFWFMVVVIFIIYYFYPTTEKKNEKLFAKQLIKNRHSEVSENYKRLVEIFNEKYESAHISQVVWHTGFYYIPISSYFNNDLKIQGTSFFIDNIKNSRGKGKIEVRKNSFQDDEYQIYNLEIIDGFAIFDPKKQHQSNEANSLYDAINGYLTIRENSFQNIFTGIVHNIKYSKYSFYEDD